MAKPIFTYYEDFVHDSIRCFVNGKQVGYADHDMHGWAGIELMKDTFDEIAKVLGVPVVEIDCPEDD